MCAMGTKATESIHDGWLAWGVGALALVAARRITPVILADYKGPRRQSETRRTLAEYFTSRRPVVFGDFSAAAWMVRGQSEGALQGRGLCPYDEDYIFYLSRRHGLRRRAFPRPGKIRFRQASARRTAHAVETLPQKKEEKWKLNPPNGVLQCRRTI